MLKPNKSQWRNRNTSTIFHIFVKIHGYTIWYVFFSIALNGIFPKSINTSSVISNKTTTSTSVNKKKIHTTHETHFKRNLLWPIFILSREYLLWYTFYRVSQSYCWKKSCTSWYGKYPLIYRVLYIPGGSSTVSIFITWFRQKQKQLVHDDESIPIVP